MIMGKWIGHVLVALLVTVGLMLAGCGNDKPPAPMKQKSADGEKAGEEKGKPGEQKKETTGEGEKAGAEGEAVKAEGEAAGTEGAVKEAAPIPVAEATRAKATQVQLDRTLRKVTAYGVTGPIDSTRDKIIDMLPTAVRAKAREGFEVGLKGIAGENGLTNMEWLDLTRGLGFAFEGKDKPLLAIPIVSAEAFKAALPDGLTADEANGYTIADNYMVPYEKVLFMTDSSRTLELIEGDLKLELTRLSTDKTVLLVLGGASLKVLLSSALDEAEREMSENMPMQQEQKEFLAKLFNFMKELLGEIEQIRITMDLAGENLVLRYEITTVDGSRLGQSLGMLEAGSFKAAGFLPAKSYLVMAQNVDSASAAPFMNRYIDLVATAWKLKEEERGEFAKMYTRLVTMFGPDAAFSMYADSSFPMAMSSVTQTKDGMAARDQIYAFYMLVLNKVIEELPQDQRQIFASGSLKQVVDSFAPVLLNLGVGVKMDSEEYRTNKIDYLVFTFDWEKLSLPPSYAVLKQIIRSRIGCAIGFSQEYMVFTFGPNPIVRAKEVLDQTPGLKLVEMIGPGVEEDKYVVVAGLSVERLMGAILDVGVVAAMIGQEPWVEKVRHVKSLVLTAGTSDGALWTEAVVGVASIIQAFEDELTAEILNGGKNKEAIPLPKPIEEEEAPAVEAAPAPAVEPAVAQ
jgi:hypothetical protein